ncbi:MAG: PDZ domain-containing protein [Ginsengibacter sp.]
MKKNIFFAALLATTLLLSINAWSQKPGNDDKKSKEIVIRQNSDKNTKMTIVVDGDNITVNGKPLSDYHDGEVSIMKRDLKRNSHNFLFTPENDEDMELNVDDDMENVKPRTFLGVITEKTTDGVKITSVINGSAAEKAGLQKDDIITMLNDKKIISPEDLMDAVKFYKPDDNVKIDYIRNHKNKDVKVKLGETKEKNRTFFKETYPGMGGNSFNFKMPRMPKMPNLPNTNFNYKFWGNNTPKLGVKIEDTENGGGAKILNVEGGSVADKAGLKKDDIITEINGEKVNDVNEIREQLNETSDKESFNLKAKRNNAEMNFEIKIPKQLNSADL